MAQARRTIVMEILDLNPPIKIFLLIFLFIIHLLKPLKYRQELEVLKAASATWNMGEWDQMYDYVSCPDDRDETKLWILRNTAATSDVSSNGTFFRDFLLVRRGKYDKAREFVERAR